MKKDTVRELIKTGQKIVKEKLVVDTGGNISARRGSDMAIKAKKSSLDSTKRKDYALINIKSGRIKRGIPSSEKEMHLACYRKRPDIKAVLHLHPVFSTAVANSKIKLKTISYELAASLGSELVRAKYKPSGSRSLAKEIGRLIKKHNAILMPNHGIIVVGNSLDSALKRVFAVERACQTLVFSRLLGIHSFLPKKEAKRIMALYNK